jgi:hypothetical protein
MRVPHVTTKLAGWVALVSAVAIAVVIMLLKTDLGAEVVARMRCASTWVTSDATAYRACADFEREQILEQHRHTPED